MNFMQCDSYSGFFDFPTESESPLCDFQENGAFLSDCPMIDRYGCDNPWLNDDKVSSLHLKSTSPPLIRQLEPAYPERSILLGFRKRRLSDLPKSEPLVTKTNHYIYKDDFLWNDSKELPDVILVSPRRENTPDPNINTLFNFDDEKANLNFDFDNALRNVQVENGMVDYSVDLVTKEDVEYLDSLLAGFTDQSAQSFDQDVFDVKSRNDVASDLSSSFNEISCNINQQGVVTDSKSAIKTLLKYDTFKGNFHMKKSTEILSEIDQSHDCFAEHNYFSPTKVSKPRSTNINSETSDNTTKCIVPCALSPTHVPIPVEDFVIETEVSSTPSSSLNLKTPQIVLSQCAIPATSSSTSTSVTPVKCKNRDLAKKVAKKPVLCKTDPDPTYTPNAKRRRPAKKSPLAKNKTNPNPQSKLVAPVAKFNTCSIAQLPRIPIKPANGAEPRPIESANVLKSRLPAIEVPKVAPRVPATSNLVSTVPEIEPDPVDFAGLSTPLASPTRDDVLDHDFSNEDSCQPETNVSNVDSIVDPIQPVEETPKIEKKKISLQEYLQKRATKTKTDPENVSGTLEDPEPIESMTMASPPNVEEILRTIVKPEPLQIDDVLKTISKSDPKPVVKTEPANVAPPKPVIKSEQAPVDDTFVPVVKSEPVPKPAKISKNCELKKEPIRQRGEAHAKKPMAKPRRNPATLSKPLKEPVNNTPLKLIKLAIPDKAPSVRSYSLSPNEISQSIECDRYSSSGVSSYHNSSVSSTCGSPFTVHDDKSNDTKYSDSERIATSKQQQSEKKMPQIPFAVNKELLRKDDRSSKKRKHRRDRRRRSDSITRKRRLSDSCFEDDSDCSDYSDRKRSRKRYSSTSSSSSSDKSYHHRSYSTECSISPRAYHEYCDWKYPNLEMVPEPYYYNYNELPNTMFYPAPPPAPWHPEFGPYYPPYAPNMEVPYYNNYSGCHEPGMDISGDVEVHVERRALFVGNFADDVTENDLHRRFEKFGDIEFVKIHRRDSSNRFGFVYYTDEKYVRKAIKYGNDDPNLPPYKLSVGMRKERSTADRRAFTYDKAIPVTNFQPPCYQEQREDTYSLKLEQLKNDLKQKKLGSRYK